MFDEDVKVIIVVHKGCVVDVIAKVEPLWYRLVDLDTYEQGDYEATLLKEDESMSERAEKLLKGESDRG